MEGVVLQEEVPGPRILLLLPGDLLGVISGG